MTELIKVGDRVTHYRYGDGIVERLASHEFAEVRFGSSLQYVEQKNIHSFDGESRKEESLIKKELARKESIGKEEMRQIVKNNILSLLEIFEYESAQSLYKENCAEWWALSDYKEKVEASRKTQTAKEIINKKIKQEKYREEVCNLLINGLLIEADRLYKEKCTEWWKLKDYKKEKKQSSFIRNFINAYKRGSISDLDKLYNNRPKEISLATNDFISLKLPRVRSHLKEIEMELDEEQEIATSHPNPRVLIKARAGSGKTRTLCARTVLAIQDEKIDPNQVMVLAFNKSAAEEIKNRIKKAGKIGSYDNARTFHSLAFQIAKTQKKLLFDQEGAPSAREQSRFVQKTLERILNPAFKDAMVQFFRKELEQIENIGRDLPDIEYLHFRKYLELITLQGEKVRSNGEKFIADFLFEHDITYQYERAWAWKTDFSEGMTYRPDFSIIENGHDYILEHWAINPENHHSNLPDHWDISTEEYRDQIFAKRDFWKKNKKRLIETHAELLHEGREIFEIKLKKILEGEGIVCRKLPKEEIIKRVFENDFTISRMSELFLQFIQHSKKRGWSIDAVSVHISESSDVEPRSRLFYKLALRAYREYEIMLKESNAIDFDDILSQAAKDVKAQGASTTIHLGHGRMMPLSELRWILLDEYQDFSELYFRMLDEILKANPLIRLVAVGDDWQAINAFAGAELRFFESFSTYFQGADTVEVTTNYRSGIALVSAGNQLMDGHGSNAKASQYGLGLIEKKYLDDTWVEFRQGNSFKADREVDSLYLSYGINDKIPSENNLQQARALKICAEIIIENPKENTLILARTGRVYGIGLEDFRSRLIDIISVKIKKSPKFLKKTIFAMTAHRSKGQEAYRVIVLDATQRQFPKIHSDNFLFNLFGVTPHSVLEDERRLFYVAITRAENRLYILTEKENESPYINEIMNHPSIEKGENKEIPIIKKPTSPLAARIKEQIERVHVDINLWNSVHANVSSQLKKLAIELESLGVPAPQVKYCLPGTHNTTAEIAWPEASPPVAILTKQQSTHFEEWISHGWKVPGADLSIEKIIIGVKYYVLGPNQKNPKA